MTDIKEHLEQIEDTLSLFYISDTTPGFSRVKNGESFAYLNEKRNRITQKKIIESIEKLGIPPAWENVWISPFPNSHIQATGRDEKGRKQYIYHPSWIEMTQRNKFHKVTDFIQSLPSIRQSIEKDMSLPNLSEKKVLGTIVWLLENTYIRIGNDEYAKENNHFGLTTFTQKHVSVKNKEIEFHFVGKSGKEHQVNISNPKVSRIIDKLEELPGYELFQFIDLQGKRFPLKSDDVNEYLKEISHQEITAKDFRTWGGTLLAGKKLHQLGTAITQKEKKKNISSAVRNVSQHLRNTPTVSRKYYVHPTIISTYMEDILIPHFQEYSQKKNDTELLSQDEFVIKELLKKYEE